MVEARRVAWILPAVVMPLALVSGGCRPEQVPAPVSEAQPIRFANPGLLVETEWLAAHLDDTDVRIVDTRDAEAYQAGHVPGAVNIPRAATFDPEELGSIVGRPDHIAALFGAGGIDETAHVIVHDEGRSTAAPRVFWTLEYYGHPNVSVLDGGFTKWEAEGRDVRTETPDITPVTFTVEPRPDRLSTKQSLLADLGREDVAMVDARSPEEHRGESVRSARGGHIPGAINIDWRENFTEGEVPVFKPPAELTEIYTSAGITRDKRLHAY